MCKKLFIAVILTLFVMVVASCSPQNTSGTEAHDDSNDHEHHGHRETSYNSEAEFKAAISDRNSEKQEHTDDAASSADDIITEYYRPVNLVKGVTFEGIDVTEATVVFYYSDSNHEKEVNFTWFRHMDPQVAMNLSGLGAISEREVEHKGIKYVFLEWDEGYSIHWVKDGKAFQAWFPKGYTEKEILDFCDFEVVVVE